MTAPTFADLLLAQRGNECPAVFFEDTTISYAAFVDEALAIAALIGQRLDGSRPPHVGVLLDNVPEYLLWSAGAAFAGAAIVGINPTRRGAELAGDIEHTDIQFIVTETTHRALLPDGYPLLVVDDDGYRATVDSCRGIEPESLPDPATPLFLLFTSGSTSAPKAVVCNTGRMAGAGLRCAPLFGLTADDVSYCPMPLFHGNALLACWAPTVAAAAPVALRRKFSASGFLADVRRYRCTFFTYVGRSIDVA